MNFDVAENLISELVSQIKSGKESSIKEFANLIEFIDRVKFEFDFLPIKFLAFVRAKCMELLGESRDSDLKEYLLTFRPGDERPYYLDDLELILTGKEK